MNNTFTINVLTPGQRKARYGESNKTIVLLLPILTWLILAYGLYTFMYLPTYSHIQRQQMTLRDLNLDLTRLNALRSKLEKQQALYLSTAGERVGWSSKLASFSLLIPDDIWITRIFFAEQDGAPGKPPVLEIFGQTVSRTKQESLDKIAIFIEDVNKDSSYRLDFYPIEFIYSQLRDEQKSIMDFKLSSLAKAAQIGDKQ
ncbi:MAG: hypothetical protein AB1847_17950 [bacterium]